jgi:hypothetical protein
MRRLKSTRSGTICTGTRTRFRRIRPRTARSAARAMTVMADTFGEQRKFTMETREVDKAGPMSGKIGRWIRRRAASRASRRRRSSARCRACTSATTSATTRSPAMRSVPRVGRYAADNFLGGL